MEIAIRTENLSKTFRVGFLARKLKAVEDLSLQVQRAEIFGLLGPNGAGKTTTIKMLLGFVRPTRGQAWVAGQLAGSLAARRKLGYLPENPALYEFLTGEEYLRFAGRLAGLSRRDAATRAAQLLEQVGLAGRADRAGGRWRSSRAASPAGCRSGSSPAAPRRCSATGRWCSPSRRSARRKRRSGPSWRPGGCSSRSCRTGKPSRACSCSAPRRDK